MQRGDSRWRMTRRRFAFWVGLGLFRLAEATGADRLDDLAAATMRSTEPSGPIDSAKLAEHWTAAENNNWRWFEREHLIDGAWKPTGVTTPVHKRTGQLYTGKSGYLDESLVPDHMRRGDFAGTGEVTSDDVFEFDSGQPSKLRRARHGRPPSRWLRSLRASELRIWLKKIDVPEAGVEGMTYWEHLTRDHSFDPLRIAGLSEDEQAKLHAAAHYGY